jgi:pSer/pThr/pTyr-binding forkhead associated (FHA) protein
MQIVGNQNPNQMNEILSLKAVEGQLVNNAYLISEAGASMGRHSASNNIVIAESFVSRRHCEIKYTPEIAT